MTLICIPIMVEADEATGAQPALEQAARAIEAGARLIEWRIDHVTDTPDLIARLLSESPAPCIVTCRPTTEGGEYDGTDSDRIAALEHLALEHTPSYLDVELATYERSANLAQKVRLVIDHPNQLRATGTRLILSTHDFTGRPKDLYNRLGRMAQDDACAVIKVAWTARSLRDNIEAFELLQNRTKPTIALCMGRFGLLSRVLAPKFGAFLTFARADDTLGTAPGQPGIGQLRETYHFDAINKHTRTYGIVGWPAEHSIGPVVHNAAFRHADHDGVYLPLPIPPEYEHFKATIGSLIDYGPLDFSGASITTPHKENALRFVREHDGTVDPMTDLCGAANTLTIDRSTDVMTLHAANTDVEALVDSVCDALQIARDGLAGRSVAVIGAGGAARAAAVGFALAGVGSITLHNRTEAHAHALADELSRRLSDMRQCDVPITAAGLEAMSRRPYDLIIQTTPVGMADPSTPDRSDCPLPDDVLSAIPWSDCALALDLIYTPAETPFLRAARQAGCHTRNGKDMFSRQALGQLHYWLTPEAASLLNAGFIDSLI